MNNLIKREDAVETIYEALRTPLPNYNNDFFHDSMSIAIAMANNIPSAKPERMAKVKNVDEINVHCGNCDTPLSDWWTYCPSCGARLEWK